MAKVDILRTSGALETHEIAKGVLMDTIRRKIGASSLDVVNLRDGRIMLVDDMGMVDGRPQNPGATEIYWSVCRPGTIHPICGDVAIAFDRDFA